MSRILLADNSPHAQRMGVFILREDGFEVVSVTDGETALVRLADVDPDLILADVSLPKRSGYEICHAVKSDPGRHHTRVVLTAGAMEPIDEEEARRVQADGSLRKPFEATMMLDIVRPLVESARKARELVSQAPPPVDSLPQPPAEVLDAAEAVSLAETAEDPPGAPQEGAALTPVAEEEPQPPLPPSEADPQSVRAAVTLALEAALPVLIDEITLRVMTALSEQDSRPEGEQAAKSASVTQV